VDGTPVWVELGCGDHRRPGMTYGVDLAPGAGVTHRCAVGFEPLPFPDASVDAVWAWDFLEHVPSQVWVQDAGRWQVRYPRVAALREIYRVLKPGGFCFSATPIRDPEWAQDPTHTAPPWRPETWDYFCGGHPDVAPRYGITFAFRCVQRDVVGAYLCVTVVKPAEEARR
jgi:SAM-dependent methyltransferase